MRRMRRNIENTYRYPMFVPLTLSLNFVLSEQSPRSILIVPPSIIILVINPPMKGCRIRAPTDREGAPSVLYCI